MANTRALMSMCACAVALGMALNSAMRVGARVQIPVCPEPPLVFSHDLLGGLRTGFLVVSPLRIACAFLLVERGRSSKRVWRSPRIIYFIAQIIAADFFSYLLHALFEGDRFWLFVSKSFVFVRLEIIHS
jgi:hypothetical protein